MTVHARSPYGAAPIPGSAPEAAVSVPPEALLVRASEQGVVLFHPGADPRLHAGRNSIRRTILRMVPDLPDDRDLLPPECGDRMFWGMTANNGMLAVLRIGGFPTVDFAHRDAVTVLARYRSLRPVPVTDTETGLRSLWLVASRHVQLVSGQAWRSSSRGSKIRQLLGPAAPWKERAREEARAWETARAGHRTRIGGPPVGIQRP